MEEDALFISRSWTAATEAAEATLTPLLPLLPTPLLLPTPPPPPASRGRGPVTEESQPRGEEVERRPLKALSLLLLLLLLAVAGEAAETAGTRPLFDMCSVQNSAEPTVSFRSWPFRRMRGCGERSGRGGGDGGQRGHQRKKEMKTGRGG